MVRQEFDSYLVQKKSFYASQTRWQNRPFWKAKSRTAKVNGAKLFMEVGNSTVTVRSYMDPGSVALTGALFLFSVSPSERVKCFAFCL